MDRQPTLLELIALRLSEPTADHFEYLGMATLLSPAFAVTTYHVAGEEQRDVLLHFDLWPEPFTLRARVVAVDREADLAVLKLESDLPADQVPSFKLATRRKSGEQWESILLGPEMRSRLSLKGRMLSEERLTIRLMLSEGATSLHGLSGAPVLVGDDLIGIIAAFRDRDPTDTELQAISAEAIQNLMAKRVVQTERAPEKETAADSNDTKETATVSSRAGSDHVSVDSSAAPAAVSTAPPVTAPTAPVPDTPFGPAALFQRLSRASLRALSHAEGIQRAMRRGKVHTEQLIAGLYEKEDGPLRALMRTAGLDGDGLLKILAKQAGRDLPRLPGYGPVSLHELPALSDHVRAAFIKAQKAADEDESDAINSWHLLYGVLAVEDCDLTKTLRARGLVNEKVRRGRAPDRTAARSVARPNIAGFSSDDPRKGTDRFGITREVKALCSVLAAKSVDPPLSLGLFGDWGSGKSFFMGQMDKEFSRLKELARGDPNSSYCPNIVQLWFNAWHYMDTNLWASLASEIFEGLAQELVKDEKLDVGQTDPGAARARLLAATASKRDVLAEAERRKGVAETELRDSEARLERLKNVDQELADSLSVRAISHAAYRFVASQPEVKANIRLAGETLNLPAAEIAATETKARLLELKGPGGRAKALYLAIRHAKSYRLWLILLLCVALVLIAVPLGVLFYSQHQLSLARLLSSVSVFLAGLSGLAFTIKPYLARVADAFKIIENARTANEAALEERRTKQREELEKRREQVKEKLSDATQQVQESSAEVRQLEQQLDELRADRQMANFIRQRYESQDYTSQLGTIARARNDFERLSDLLAKVKTQVSADAEAAARAKGAEQDGQQSGAATGGTTEEERLLLPRIDRIVLYIDDLDRCPEDKVVDVLQAVHLLLAFPLFVVIVGVDPRWLLHSLKQHAKVFQGEPKDGEDGTDEESRHWQSTPLNYLEKIFQIPFTLRPMAYNGFGDFIEDLARTPETSQHAAGHDGAGPPTIAVVKTEQSQPALAPTGGQSAPPVIAQVLQTMPASLVAPTATAGQSAQSAQIGRGPAAGANADAATKVQPNDQSPRAVSTAESQPEHLHIEDWERNCMKELFWLIPSPRASKRFVNIYRLLRATVPEEKRGAFVGDATQGQYRAALLLLAILTGYPAESADILRELLAQERERPWWQFIDGYEAQVVAEAKNNPANGQGHLSEAAAENLRQLFLNLNVKEVRSLIPDNESCADFIDWAPEVARYSFQSGRVLLARRDSENSEDD